MKVPDAALFVSGRLWPTIVVECGYIGTYASLQEDTKLLLEGSEGRIGKVIVVKLEEIGPNGGIDAGFVEVWEYNRESQKAKRRGGHFVGHPLPLPLSLLTFVMKLYPAPLSRQTQAVRFTAAELLRNRYEAEKTADMQPDDILPPLYLEPLRKLVAANCERHLAFENRNHDDLAELECRTCCQRFGPGCVREQ